MVLEDSVILLSSLSCHEGKGEGKDSWDSREKRWRQVGLTDHGKHTVGGKSMKK